MFLPSEDRQNDIGYLKGENMEHIEIKVAGLRCDNCSAFVERELNKLQGTYNVSVSFPLMLAVLDYDPTITNIDEIYATINNEEKGFSVA